MKISRLTHLTGIAAAATFSGLVLVTLELSNIQERIVSSEGHRFHSYQVAEEVRQSSDDLTRMARTYAVTGDPLYERQYFAVLDIRSGQLPRPQNYSSTYWYLAPAQKPASTIQQNAVPLQNLIHDLDFSPQELSLLRESLDRSNALVKLEKQAFAAMKGLFDDGQGNFTAKAPANQEFAIHLLYSERYLAEKVRIMEPIQSTLRLVDTRTNQALRLLHEEQQKYLWFALALSIGALFGVALVNNHVRRAIVYPLKRLGQQASAIARGSYDSRCDIQTGNELAQLGTHFNAMAEAIELDVSQRKLTELREHWRNHVLELLAKGAPLPAMLNAVVRSVEEEGQHMLCSILLLDSEGKHLLTGASPSLPDDYNKTVHGAAIGPAAGSCGTAAWTQKRVIVEDIQSHPYWAPYKHLATAADLASCWSEPIRVACGKVVGTFAIYHRTVRSPTLQDIQLIEHAANLAGLAIERHRAEEALQLAAMVYEHCGEAIIVTDARDNIIAINPSFTQMTGYTIEDVIGKKPTHCSERRQGRTSYRSIRRALKTSNIWQGEMWNRRKNGEEFTEWLTINTIRNEAGAIHRHVYLFSDITEKKQSEELIWRQANFDLLTELPNRRLFRDRLDLEIKKSCRTNLPLALLFIDLDLFKEVNDTLGHDVGDILLIEAARRISASVRASDMVARLGGDEFTVLLAELNDTISVEQVAKKILHALAEPFQLGIEVAYLSASIGITLYPADSMEPESLLKNADQAMYVAKNLGRNRFSFFTRSMQEQAQNRLRLSTDLRAALSGGQLKLHFQPIVDLPSGRIIKGEVLLRWHHPQRGPVSPAEFIPIAEESGLINEIGDWVFRESAAWAQRWSKQLGHPFQISVNKSPVQFFSQTRYTSWPDYLKELGLSGACIAVEITEGLLLNAAASVNEQLLQFRDAGIEVSIDDFGTGYSSMSYLKKFHIDYLKIDQSFVRDMSIDAADRAIAEAIIVMAHKLGYKVIAEGIETAEQRNMLAAAHCDFGQGYLFSRPMPPEEFELLLTNNVSYQETIG